MSTLAAKNAARQRRFRARARAGEIVLTITVPEQPVAAYLVETGRLPAECALDKPRLAAAIVATMVDLSARWMPPK